MAEALIEKDVEIGDVNDGMVRFKEDGAKLKESSKGRLLTHDRLAPRKGLFYFEKRRKPPSFSHGEVDDTFLNTCRVIVTRRFRQRVPCFCYCKPATNHKK